MQVRRPRATLGGVDGTKARRRRRRLVLLVLGLVVLGGAGFFFVRHRDGGKGQKGAPASEVVRRGDVRATVAGVGSLQPKKTVSLGFGAPGRVRSVEVRLGQKVRAGQVLARLDDRLPRANLTAARAQVSATAAKVEQLTEAHTPQERRKVEAESGSAAKAVRGAGRSLAKARRVAAGDVATLHGALHHAKETHQVAVRRLAAGRAKLSAGLARVASLKAAVGTARGAVETARARSVAVAGTKEATRKAAEDEEARERARFEAEEVTERRRFEEEEAKERKAAEAAEKEFTPKEFRPKERSVTTRNAEAGIGSAEAGAQAGLETAQTSLSQAEAKLERQRGELDTARAALPDLRETARTGGEAVALATTALRSGRASAGATVRTAVEAAETAHSLLRTAQASGAAELQPTRRGEMAEALAAVSTAESNLAADRKAVAETVLRAPTAGRVSNLKLAVGDVVSGGQTSQAAPSAGGAAGGEASGSGEGGSGESEGAGGSSAATGTSGGGPSIVLTSPHLKLFSVLLTQSDAVEVRSGDPASVLVDALHRTVKGHLVNVMPLPQVKNGVVDYTATVAAVGLPSRLRVGMTAEVTVETGHRRGVPLLPRSALPATAGSVRLQVLAGGKRKARTVRLGLAGDEDVEVKGLRPGERVLLPQEAEVGSGAEAELEEEEGFEG